MGKLSIKLKDYVANSKVNEEAHKNILEKYDNMFENLAEIEQEEKKQEIIYLDKIVHVEKIIEVPVDKIIYVDNIIEIPIEIEKIIYVDKPIHIDRIVERIVEVEKPFEVVRLQFQKVIPKWIYGALLLEAMMIVLLILK